ncbi:hypothetical protein ACVIHC_005241 [Bradyrhizobium diazoefficiens]
MSPDLLKLIFGRLGLESLPLHEPIVVGTFVVVALGGATLLGGLTYFRLWGYLWREWFTTVDHKRIGIMYMILGIVMLLRGFADALMMRGQQMLAFGGSEGYLNAHHYDQVFTAHGVIMIFFVAMPLVTGLMNYVVPLQIGARDVSFPFLNNFSFWMTVGGAVLVMASLFIGEFARTGWLAYPPLSNIGYSPDVGVDYYIWALQVAGVGTTLSGINLICTIVKLRCPGMTMMKMPVFTWTSLCTNILIVASFPVLTVVLALLSLDRYVGTNFFTNDFGGSPMMYVNLIWIWGHPEVYILVLPAFGIFSEVTSTFSGKRLFGYTSMVYATVVITILSYLVWLHHFFTMGSGASVNSFFGITTMIISIPTGAKMFNWLFTMYRGRIRYELPMMWTIAFMLTFVLGRHDRRSAGGAAGRLRAAQQPVPDRALPQRDHRRRGVRRVRRNQLLVPEGVRLQARCVLGQAVVLVLGRRLLPRLHAALCARPDGRDPPPARVRRSVLADMVRHRRDRRRPRLPRHSQHADAVRGQLPQARAA